MQMWETIHELVSAGSTVLLTTQYMEEADRLADDILVIDRGRMIAHGTADELKTETGGERIELVLSRADNVDDAQRILTSLSMGEVQFDRQTRRLTASVTGGADTLRQVLQRLAEGDITIADVGLRRPTLDDVFLTLTGHAAEDVAEEQDGAANKTEIEDSREKEAVG
jgi:ABC-2 type transport system ATP-binding protein